MRARANHRGAHGLRRKLYVISRRRGWSCSAVASSGPISENRTGRRAGGDNIRPRRQKANDFGRNTCGQQTGLHQCLRDGESVPSITSTISSAIRRVTSPAARRSANGRRCLHRSTHPNHLPRFMSVNHAPVAVGFQQRPPTLRQAVPLIFPASNRACSRCHRRCRYSVPDTAVVQKGLCPGSVTGDHGFEVRPGAGTTKSPSD